jgi:hypothetical protein
LAEREWNGTSGTEDTTENPQAAWRRSLADLFQYASRFQGDPEYRLDPFADDAVFPSLFKVFHGFANQLGLSVLDEAFAHHLLLQAATPSWTAAPPVRLLDLGEEETRPPASPRPTPVKASVRGGQQWHHFVARSGPEGKRWVEEYGIEQRLQLAEMTERALQQLRGQQIRAGKELLEEVESRLERLEGAPSSVLLVMKRFFWATLAYYHYCIDDLDRAEQTLDLAHQAVVSAIEAAPCLLPLALHCHEFRLQHARIARRRRRWSEMREHLQTVRAMLEDRIPLCILSDGRPIYLSALTGSLRSIPSLDLEEIESLRFFLDEEHRRECIGASLMSLYVLPGVVIHSP